MLKDGRPPLSFGHFPRERGKPSVPWTFPPEFSVSLAGETRLLRPLDSRVRGNDD